MSSLGGDLGQASSETREEELRRDQSMGRQHVIAVMESPRGMYLMVGRGEAGDSWLEGRAGIGVRADSERVALRKSWRRKYMSGTTILKGEPQRL